MAHIKPKALCVFISIFLEGEILGAEAAPCTSSLPIALIYIIGWNPDCVRIRSFMCVFLCPTMLCASCFENLCD